MAINSTLARSRATGDISIMDRRQHNHFYFHGKNDPTAAADEAECHYCQIKAFSTDTEFPISLVFDKGETKLIPKNFKFIEETVLTSGVQLATDNFLSGCSCADGYLCMNECDCLADVDDGHPGLKKNAYHVVGDRKGCLRNHMLDSRKPVYECHARCSCSSNCPNRVVGAGRKINLQIFPTADNRGWGVRSTEDIKRGQFVGSYVGELITAEEAHRRRLAGASMNHKDVYLFALDKFSDPYSSDTRLRDDPYEIDGEFLSGPTRFINHSCDPNLRIFAVVTDHANKPFHGLAFFALRDIDKETELTFDYTDGISGKEDFNIAGLTQAELDNLTKCLCGSSKCRQYLW